MSDCELFIKHLGLECYNTRSRIHPLRTLTNAFVKRDDELSSGISGSKIRKYASLIPYIRSEKFSHIIVIGGAYSNNVLGISQLLIENGLKATYFLLKPEHLDVKGNLFFSSLLIDPEQIVWVTRSEWPNVLALANNYCTALVGEKGLVLPEGVCIEQALPGAMTLSTDVIRNEQENGLNFEHIFVDSGTGLQAIALILGHLLAEKKSLIHVLLLADSPEIFHEKLKQFHRHLELFLGRSMELPVNFVLHKPTTAASFGAVNRTIFGFVEEIARKEGFFVDPIYSGKLFYEAKKIIADQNLKNALIIHSGGALTLSGFQSKTPFTVKN
jgi:1-aminocyclopropane-1-carboxylate deaminase